MGNNENESNYNLAYENQKENKLNFPDEYKNNIKNNYDYIPNDYNKEIKNINRYEEEIYGKPKDYIQENKFYRTRSKSLDYQNDIGQGSIGPIDTPLSKRRSNNYNHYTAADLKREARREFGNSFVFNSLSPFRTSDGNYNEEKELRNNHLCYTTNTNLQLKNEPGTSYVFQAFTPYRNLQRNYFGSERATRNRSNPGSYRLFRGRNTFDRSFALQPSVFTFKSRDSWNKGTINNNYNEYNNQMRNTYAYNSQIPFYKNSENQISFGPGNISQKKVLRELSPEDNPNLKKPTDSPQKGHYSNYERTTMSGRNSVEYSRIDGPNDNLKRLTNFQKKKEEYLEQRENPRDSIRGQMNLKNGEYIFQYGDELLKEVPVKYTGGGKEIVVETRKVRKKKKELLVEDCFDAVITLTKGVGGTTPADEFSVYLLNQINSIRENPKLFIKMIEEAKKNIRKIKGTKLIYKKNLKVLLNRGMEAFNDTISELNQLQPMEKLIFSPEITVSQPTTKEEYNDKYFLHKKVEELVDNGYYIKSYWKELIKDPEICFILMIVDDNDKFVEQKRRDLLDPNMKYIGLSSSENKFGFQSFVTLTSYLYNNNK